MPDISSDGGSRAVSRNREPVIALLPGGDRFEDFHDRIGVSMEDLKDGMTGTWLFNYVETLQAAGMRPVLYFVSARVSGIVRFTHPPTGASIRFLPAPWLHRKLQGARDRVQAPAAAIGRLLDDEPLRRLLGERARQRAESEFSLQTVRRLRAFMEQRGAFR
jgi:hypothetical protein